MKKLFVSACLLLLGFLQFSCVSMTYLPLYQKLHLNVQPTGTKFELLGNGVVLQTGRTPAVLKIRKVHGLVIRFSNKDHESRSVYLQMRGDRMLYPISLGLGLFSMCLTFGADVNTGAVYKMTPSVITFRLDRRASSEIEKVEKEPELKEP